MTDLLSDATRRDFLKMSAATGLANPVAADILRKSRRVASDSRSVMGRAPVE